MRHPLVTDATGTVTRMRRALATRGRNDRWARARALPCVALLLLAAGCSDDRTEANGEAAPYVPGEIATIERQQWRDAGIFDGADDFSDDELRCIDAAGADIAAPDLAAAADQTFAQASNDVRAYKAMVFDGCLSADHLERWFFTDMLNQAESAGFTPGSAGCLSERLVGLLRAHGFDATFVTRSEEAFVGLVLDRTACGIGSDCAALAITMDRLVSGAEIPTIDESDRDGLADAVDEQLAAWCPDADGSTTP